MNNYDDSMVERLVQEITDAVLSRLDAENTEVADGSAEPAATGEEKIGAAELPITSLIDHTALKADTTQHEIVTLCEEARTYGFASVCVNPTYVPLAAALLAGSPVEITTVVGFPLGANRPAVKAFETEQAIADGATEIDMVINIGALKSQDYQSVLADIGAVVEAAHRGGAIVKVIIEAALLSDEEIVIASRLAKMAGADYVKTSTGFGPGGATVEAVALMRQTVGPEMGVKAAGGIRDYEDARKMVAAGATRLGASAGVQIAQQAAEVNADAQEG